MRLLIDECIDERLRNAFELDFHQGRESTIPRVGEREIPGGGQRSWLPLRPSVEAADIENKRLDGESLNSGFHHFPAVQNRLPRSLDHQFVITAVRRCRHDTGSVDLR